MGETTLIILSMAVFALLNAFRGAGAQWLRYGVGALAGALAWAAAPAALPADLKGVLGFAPLWTGLGLYLWLLQPWGRWYMLGSGSREWAGPASPYESALERIADRLYPPRTPQLARSGRADSLAWLMSASLFALPLALLASPWWLLLPPLAIGLYWIALMRFGLGPHVRWGEAGTGALMGLMIMLLSGCAALSPPAGRGSILHDPHTATIR